MFIIVWRGYGILVPVLAVLVGFVPLAAVESVIGSAKYQPFAGVLALVTCSAAAAAIWVVGRALNGQPGRVLVDPNTGQRVVLRKRHDLFWIPFEWWSVAVAAFGVISLFGNH
jgi:hypothetical protein